MKRFPPFRDPSSVTRVSPKTPPLVAACRLLAVLGAALMLNGCVDTSDGGCAETLSCADAALPLLDGDCKWRLPDGSVWQGGPERRSDGIWYWPNSGERSETQNFRCGEYEEHLGGTGGTSGAGGADNGGMGGVPMSVDLDAGVDQTDCTLEGVGCDAPLVCDEQTGRCVDCLSDSECSTDRTPDTPACDTDSNTCVECIEDSHCQALSDGARPFCRLGDTPDENSCVQCTDDSSCSGATPVCNVAAGDCTVTCTSDAECSANSETPRCDTTTNQCVQCLIDDQCEGDFQCQDGSRRCVPCTDSSACGDPTPVCEVGKATCVQCLRDDQCSDPTPFCDEQDRTCGQCLDDGHCTNAALARCNLANNTCDTCNADSQCSTVPGGLNRCLAGDGRCVRCVEDSHCTFNGNGRNRCALAGQPLANDCVQCVGNDNCGDLAASRCDLNSGSCAGCNADQQCSRFNDTPNCFTAQSRCVQCVDSADCNGNSNGPACKTDTNRCVECVVDANCNGNPSGPVCDTLRNQCVQCLDNDDCGGDTPICDTSVSQCVQCLNDSQCTDPAASNCDEPNKTCVACSNNGECSGITVGGIARNVCVASEGLCVQCTGTDFEERCGGFVCESRNRVCSTQFTPNSGQRCSPCVSDAQCPGGFACRDEIFDGQNLGAKCFPLQQNNLCGRQFSALETAPSFDDDSRAFCVLDRTTCAGVADTGNPCDNDSDCGADGVADGVCQQGAFCTVPCDSTDDCNAERFCQEPAEICAPNP